MSRLTMRISLYISSRSRRSGGRIECIRLVTQVVDDHNVSLSQDAR